MYIIVLNYWSADHTQCGADLSWWFIHLYCYAVSGCRREKKCLEESSIIVTIICAYMAVVWDIINNNNLVFFYEGIAGSVLGRIQYRCKGLKKNAKKKPVVNSSIWRRSVKRKILLLTVVRSAVVGLHCSLCKKKERFEHKRFCSAYWNVFPFPFPITFDGSVDGTAVLRVGKAGVNSWKIFPRNKILRGASAMDLKSTGVSLYWYSCGPFRGK